LKTVKHLFLLMFVCVCGMLASAQSVSGLNGTVTDPTGAVVPGTHVQVKSLATGLTTDLTSNQDGIFVAPSLLPGDYTIEGTASGFGKVTIPKVTLPVDTRVTVNLKLSVASGGDSVQVESSSVSLIETTTMTVGQVIDNFTVQELPLNGRHFLDLTVLTPGGVVAPTSGSLTAASRGLGANSFITAGNREDSVNFQINGINLNDITQNQITFQPSISTTSEFKINNQTFSAEYGRSDGSIVTVATRSGTDKFHGEAFDYFRNEALDARNFFNRGFNPATGVALAGNTGNKAPLKRNNFGGSIGGPIWHGHTFFYASYEGLRQHQGILQNSTVFTPAQQAAFAANAAADPIAANIAKLIPLPNSGNNYVSFTPGPVQIDQYTGDVLHQFNSNNFLHGFYAFQKDVRTEPALQGDTIPGWGDNRAAHRQIGTLSYVHTFTPTISNEARIGFNRINISFNPANLTSPASVGIVDGLTGNVGLPQTSLTDIGLTFGGPSGFPQGRATTTGVFADTLTIVKGKNTIKTGGEFRRYLNYNFGGNIGSISLTTAQFSATNTPGALNQPATPSFSIQPNQLGNRIYADAVGGFVQDNFKLTPGLTLEAGLRFEWNGTPIEGENRIAIFNPNGGSPTLTQAGTHGLGADAAYKQNYNVEPRVGFAYDVFNNGKTVIRGGYGFLVDQPTAGTVSNMASNPPFTTAVSYSNSAAPIGFSNLYNNAKAASGFALAWTNPNFRNADVEDFNLNIQQQTWLGMVASIGYYGSTGHHLVIVTNPNQATGVPGSARPYPTLSTNSPIAPGASIASNISERNSIGYSNYNAMWATLAKTFAHGFEFNVNYEWAKSMDINSLGSQGGAVLPDSNNPSSNYGLSDFDVRHHFAGTAIYALPFHGNRLTSGYRIEAIMQYQTGNPVNIVASTDGYNGNTGLIRPTLLKTFARQKQYVAGQTNVTFFNNPGGQNLGGNVCDITNTTAACTFQIVATQADIPAPTATCVNATAIGASQRGVTDPCVVLSYTGLGNIQRNYGTGPGFADLDISGEKETKLFKGLTFTLRADAFDILNHPNFGQPGNNVQASTFGQITATRFATSDGGSSRQLQLSGKFKF
jgi:hypothetical protein